MTHHVTGIFQDKALAEEAVVHLEQAGYDRDEIVVAESGEKLQNEVNLIFDENDHKAMWWGGMRGFAIGAVLLGVLTIWLFSGTNTDQFAYFVIIGTLVGGTAGSFLGGLTGLGEGEEEASHFVNEIGVKNILVSVKYDRHLPQSLASEVMRKFGAVDTIVR